MAAKPNITHREIIDAVRKKQYAPIYLLMGDESYYIDRISEFIADSVLTKEEQDFNQQVIYCTKETSVGSIINSARRYPMMSEHQVIIVKEAQNLLKFEELAVYAQAPQPTTVLVICYKNGSAGKYKKTLAAIDKVGVVYESKKLKDGMLPHFIVDYLRRKKVTIEDSATQVLAESVGSDLNRLAGELDKLVLALPEGQNRVTPDLVEKHIGISKEFNVWELRSALVQKDIMKANRIIFHFEQNPKANPPVMTVAALFAFFSQLMVAHYSPDRSEQGLMQQLDLKSAWQVREYVAAMRTYSPMKTMLIIGKLRESDARLKGINRGNLTDADIMRELIFFILH